MLREIVEGTAILYADVITDSMKSAIGETDRQRGVQRSFNEEHGIVPRSVVKQLDEPLIQVYDADYVDVPLVTNDLPSAKEIPRMVEKLRKEMKYASDRLEFEKAAELRDRIRTLQEKELSGPYLLRGSENV